MEPLSLLGLAVVAVLAGAPDARDVIAEGDVTWVATTGGVVRLEHGAHRTLSTRDGLPDGTVRALLAGGAERVWVGTDRGVAALDREGRVERVLRTTSPVTALASDGDLLSTDEHGAIERLLADASLQLMASDSDAVRRATEALIAGTDDFASRRMDRSIRAALAGRSVEELAK